MSLNCAEPYCASYLSCFYSWRKFKLPWHLDSEYCI